MLNLKVVRLRKLKAQTELADRAGVAWAAVTRAERGDEVVSFANVRKLAEALEVSTDELLHTNPEGR